MCTIDLVDLGKIMGVGLVSFAKFKTDELYRGIDIRVWILQISSLTRKIVK